MKIKIQFLTPEIAFCALDRISLFVAGDDDKLLRSDSSVIVQTDDVGSFVTSFYEDGFEERMEISA